jgi:hypothetical protein
MMDTRRLSTTLIVGGLGFTVLALIWFVVAYSGALEMASDYVGGDYASRLMACLYASSAICQGAAMLGDGPSYSPMLFWIGVIALLAGMVVRIATGRSAAAGQSAVAGQSAAARPIAAAQTPAPAGAEAAPTSDEIMGFIPPGQYGRYSYILALSGAVAGLLLSPLAMVALAGFVLAVLGLTVYRPRMNVLDAHHLGLICVISVAAALLLFLSRGTFVFLLVALAQIACFYVAFNSYRHGRVVTTHNVKDEFLMALKPRTVLNSSTEPE